MIFLVFLWGLSFLIISGTVCYVSFRRGMEATPAITPARGIGEFVRDEIYHFILFITHLTERVKPHTSRVGLAILHYSKRGHLALSRRLFGRMISERGKTASFFLKYIAEHKKNTRKGVVGERVGY